MALDAAKAERVRAEVVATLAVEELRDLAAVAQRDRRLALDRQQHDLDNDLSDRSVRSFCPIVLCKPS